MPWRPQRIADGNIALIGDALVTEDDRLQARMGIARGEPRVADHARVSPVHTGFSPPAAY